MQNTKRQTDDKSGAQKSNRLLQGIHLPALLGVILFLFVSVWGVRYVYFDQYSKQQHLLATEISQQLGARQAGLVNQFLNQHTEEMSQLESAAPDVAEQITAAYPAGLQQLENQLKAGLGESDLQVLFLMNADDRRLEEQQNFAGQELVQQAIAGEPTRLQAARIKGDWQLLSALPVNDPEGMTVGAIYTSYSLEGLQQALAVNSTKGQTYLYQQLPQAGKRAFIMTGQKLPSLPVFDYPINHPDWQLTFTGSQQLVESTSVPLTKIILLPACLAAAALLILVLALLHLRRSSMEKRRMTNEAAEQEESEDLSAATSYLDILPSGSSAAMAGDSEAKIPTTGEPALTEPQPHQPAEHESPPQNNSGEPNYPPSVFRDYDIRGKAGTQIDENFALKLGGCLGTLALNEGETALVVGWDGRLSSEALSEQLVAGILATGCDVISLGMVPTPLLSFGLHYLSETSSGVMLTASHNPAPDNGFKIFFRERALCGDQISVLRDKMLAENFPSGEGQLSERDISTEYADTIIGDIVPAPDIKVVVDAGNGVAGKNAIEVLEGIGCEVIPLYCDVDGNFPNHPPDTAVAENLEDLCRAVQAMEADLGIGLDGDGDRVTAITASGEIVWPDELLMIFARDVISRNPGREVVYDVKCTRRLSKVITTYGGRPVMCKTGHSHLRNKILECNAPLGGEFSGHIIFHDRWHGFDDGTYAAARLIEILTMREQSLDDIMASFEKHHSTDEIKIAVDEEKKFAVMQTLLESSAFKDADVNTMDGLLVSFPTAWGLVRASNTSPALTLRFEANSSEALEKIQSLFRQQLSSIDSSLTF